MRNVGERRARRWRRPVAVAAGAGLCLALAGCADESSPSDDDVRGRPAVPPSTLPHLDVPTRALVLVGANPGSGRPVQLGEGDVEVEVRRLEDGAVEVVDGIEGTAAFAFPEFRPRGAYPRAAIVVRSTSGDPMSPGESDFVFGADFRLEDPSTGREEDNGNNIVQRGLSSDDIMFKLDIDDDHRPGCTVKGAAGKLMVYARQPVEEGLWYRVHCERHGDRLEVVVSEYLPSGQITTSGREAVGETGEVTLEDPGTPLAVGAKAARDGSVIKSATDQFNGAIANPFLIVE